MGCRGTPEGSSPAEAPFMGLCEPCMVTAVDRWICDIIGEDSGSSQKYLRQILQGVGFTVIVTHC